MIYEAVTEAADCMSFMLPLCAISISISICLKALHYVDTVQRSQVNVIPLGWNHSFHTGSTIPFQLNATKSKIEKLKTEIF